MATGLDKSLDDLINARKAGKGGGRGAGRGAGRGGRGGGARGRPLQGVSVRKTVATKPTGVAQRGAMQQRVRPQPGERALSCFAIRDYLPSLKFPPLFLFSPAAARARVRGPGHVGPRHVRRRGCARDCRPPRGWRRVWREAACQQPALQRHDFRPPGAGKGSAAGASSGLRSTGAGPPHTSATLFVTIVKAGRSAPRS